MVARDPETVRILQIVPADGWYATYQHDDGTRTEWPLACWALVERRQAGECWTEVVGIDPSGEGWCGEFADDVKNFHSYSYGPGVED